MRSALRSLVAGAVVAAFAASLMTAGPAAAATVPAGNMNASWL